MPPAVATPIRGPEPADTLRLSIIDFKPSNSYPALGEPLTPAMFGFSTFLGHVIEGGDSVVTTTHVVYDAVNKKLRLYTAATGAEVATASDQSAKLIRLLGYGY